MTVKQAQIYFISVALIDLKLLGLRNLDHCYMDKASHIWIECHPEILTIALILLQYTWP
ncbi:MAG: hypothetical protein A4E59_00923 [Syntrophorhabdus sp. PtaB.Bin027]|nr:MAG: hypothetical protein A4E59_00923 [Syntrophorhabdus sp. PtaB.Bin027]